MHCSEFTIFICMIFYFLNTGKCTEKQTEFLTPFTSTTPFWIQQTWRWTIGFELLKISRTIMRLLTGSSFSTGKLLFYFLMFDLVWPRLTLIISELTRCHTRRQLCLSCWNISENLSSSRDRKFHCSKADQTVGTTFLGHLSLLGVTAFPRSRCTLVISFSVGIESPKSARTVWMHLTRPIWAHWPLWV